MADADCAFCAALGHRSCDECGGPAWGPDNLFRNAFSGRELCSYCHEDAALTA
jgi:hypothetical protein